MVSDRKSLRNMTAFGKSIRNSHKKKARPGGDSPINMTETKGLSKCSHKACRSEQKCNTAGCILLQVDCWARPALSEPFGELSAAASATKCKRVDGESMQLADHLCLEMYTFSDVYVFLLDRQDFRRTGKTSGSCWLLRPSQNDNRLRGAILRICLSGFQFVTD